jgi:hypothetical protein
VQGIRLQGWMCVLVLIMSPFLNPVMVTFSLSLSDQVHRMNEKEVTLRCNIMHLSFSIHGASVCIWHGICHRSQRRNLLTEIDIFCASALNYTTQLWEMNGSEYYGYIYMGCDCMSSRRRRHQLLWCMVPILQNTQHRIFIPS